MLQIGLGAGSLTRFLYRHRPLAKIVVIEISPDVVSAAWQFFNLPDDLARLAIEIGDGHAYVAATRKRFDLILVDGFDARGRTGMLESAPFYANCRARLTDAGMIAVNLLGRRRSAGASVRRIREAFDGRILELPTCDAGNLVVLASARPPIRISPARLSAAAKALHAQTRLDLTSLVTRLKRSGDGKPLSF